MSASDRLVFVDTCAYFAIANSRDADHANATRVLQDLIRQDLRLITTNYILAELHALLLTRIHRAVALGTLKRIDRSRATTVARVNATDELRAREILEQYDDKDFSLTDSTCFAVMERLDIRQAFTLDRNFAQYGIAVIPLD